MSVLWPENPKFCKDCKWFNKDSGWAEPICTNEKCSLLNLVLGTKHNMDCGFERSNDGVCGPEARYFEPME